MAEDDDAGQDIDPNDFPGIEETLVEARRRFDNEESRRDSIEQKIGIIITADALLISLGTLFLGEENQLQSLISLAPALISALIGLFVIRPKDYSNPLKPANEYYGYARQESEDLHDTFLLAYTQAISHNVQLNHLKVSFLHLCTSLTLSTLILLIYAQFISANQILFLVLFLYPHLMSESVANHLEMLTVNFYQIF